MDSFWFNNLILNYCSLYNSQINNLTQFIFYRFFILNYNILHIEKKSNLSDVIHGNQFSKIVPYVTYETMKKETLIEYFEEVETFQEYNGYFCSIAEAISIDSEKSHHQMIAALSITFPFNSYYIHIFMQTF